MLRYFLCLLGLLLALPLLGLIAMAISLPTSLSGMGYLSGYVLIVAGLVLAPRMQKYYLVLLVGLTVFVLVAAARVIRTGQSEGSGLRVIALPEGASTSWLNTLIDEQDSLIFGEAVFHAIGGDSDLEHTGLTSAFQTVYSNMRSHGPFASPVVSTYLNLQQPHHFDAVIIDPDTKESPEFGVIFLHGYMGNVTAQCWEIAQPVRKLGGVTVCPSTEWRGAWWQPNGQQTLKSTFDYLRVQGIGTIYLGGFSNGGFSIGRLAPQLAREKELRGLIFIDGFINGTSVRELGLPVLILEGTRDERVPVEAGRQFAMEVGPLGTYVELNADHFLIIKEPELVQHEIETWLRVQRKP